MGSYVIRVKVLPPDTTTPLEDVLKSIKGALPSSAQVRHHRVEPIAFGLSALILDIVCPEEEGQIDAVEKAVDTAPLVSQTEYMGVSRMSSKLPPQ
jgi:elongation factor 1-beta